MHFWRTALWPYITAILMLIQTPVYSQDLEKSGKALEMIRKFASEICNKPDLKGSSSSIAVQGTAKAEVSSNSRSNALAPIAN